MKRSCNPTVSAQRKKMVDNGELSKLDTSTGADGKEYPRIRKPVSVFNPTKREERAIKKPELSPECSISFLEFLVFTRSMAAHHCTKGTKQIQTLDAIGHVQNDIKKSLGRGRLSTAYQEKKNNEYPEIFNKNILSYHTQYGHEGT